MNNIRADWLNDINGDHQQEENGQENIEVDTRYGPLYDAIEIGLRRDEIEAVLEQAPEHAKRGLELFNLLKYAIEDTDTQGAVLCTLMEHDPSCARIEEREGDTLLSMVLTSPLPEEDDRMDFFRELLEAHPGAAALPDEDGYLPLHHAAYMEEISPNAIIDLLECYPEAARIPVPDCGELALHMAATRWRYMNVDVMERIFDAYPEAISIQDLSGKLPLHYAVRLARVEIIDYLATLYPQGASIQDNSGLTPLHIAHQHHTQPLEVMKLLIVLNSDGVCTADSSGMLPLHFTCGYTESIGTNLYRDRYYEHAFRTSTSKEERDKRYTDDYEELIRLLIDLFPDGVHERDSAGRLPLHHACSAPASTRILKRLLKDYPAHIAATDNHGFLPLHRACTMPLRLESIRYLVELEPYSVFKTTRNGETPLQLARQDRAVYEAEEENRVAPIMYLTGMQNVAFQEVKSAVMSTCDELGLPDLAAARVWQYAQPRLWRPG